VQQAHAVGSPAVGREPIEHEAFSTTVSAFLDGLRNVEFSAAKSMSYPTWLGQFHTDCAGAR
jgi:hypothetical protein